MPFKAEFPQIVWSQCDSSSANHGLRFNFLIRPGCDVDEISLPYDKHNKTAVLIDITGKMQQTALKLFAAGTLLW